ncbi:adenylyl transferase [Lacticaseibacillus sharpeae JCM 1186 = DSM 20505]|uniref:Adenylyl transferase n=2 Tax=Lacticaseibacillus sharpeae TaxID=1626 RepID=A0A0R1ZRA3_9LACO|nr:adenylyl transferase [Lacticaseibacillus sharpeae JCM 1186 = DSM 20505]
MPDVDSKTTKLIQNLAAVAKTVFGANLIGVYIHGSLALGSYNRRVSDLDYLIVVEGHPSQATKLELMHATFAQLMRDAPQKGLEFHVITQDELEHGQHPFRFELHYSPMHHDAYLTDPEGYVATMNGTDPDLAVHLAVVWQNGIVACGRPIKEVFFPVGATDYFDSAWRDVRDAVSEIGDNPVYTVLNLCRMRAFQYDGVIRSKAGGGRWGLQHLEPRDNALIEWALTEYAGSDAPAPASAELIRFAQSMLAQISAASRKL